MGQHPISVNSKETWSQQDWTCSVQDVPPSLLSWEVRVWMHLDPGPLLADVCRDVRHELVPVAGWMTEVALNSCVRRAWSPLL